MGTAHTKRLNELSLLSPFSERKFHEVLLSFLLASLSVRWRPLHSARLGNARHLLLLAQRRVSAWASVQTGPALCCVSPCCGPRRLAMACLQIRVETTRSFLTHTRTCSRPGVEAFGLVVSKASRGRGVYFNSRPGGEAKRPSTLPWPRRAGVRDSKQPSRPTLQSSRVKAGNRQRGLTGVT